VVATLLAARADVHLKNTYGRTALHYAGELGPELLRALPACAPLGAHERSDC
jgi:ankyrin repeat protein